ncbi:metallophosphoesterase [Methanoregula boonei 6A8]|uniref:Metallophosphoesterase n=1 Tax=Methanoregula boonei (strain DSM 21154 / JCM 14090 / 6A8) TaxID=456442 RepID=A7I8Y4_METB6|nr:metallophosphoesterase [Methanoregula boonei]ABS56195.1 metallophosphoesterase [Methanoregula boonei 6A8]
MKLEFIRDGPALVIENTERLLVVADLHFGIEADLASHGMHFRSHSRERLDRLMQTVEATRPDRLILLGDVKHSIPSLTRQEWAEIPGILDTIRQRVPVLVFPGNHDIGIERFLLPGEIQPKEGAVIDGVAYLHGHTYPAPGLAGRLLVTGHHHPQVSLRDQVGCSLVAPAFLRAAINALALGLEGGYTGTTRALFVPAFNEIAGYDIVRIAKDPFSPISRCIQQEDAEVILADGTLIGPLAMLLDDDREDENERGDCPGA